MVAGEEDPCPRVAQTDVGRLVPWGVNHLERATIADVDSLTVGHRVIRRIDKRHVVGAGGQVAGNRAQHTRWDAVSPADAKEPIDVSGRVVVPIDQFGGPLVHHEPATQLTDQSGRHADVIEVEMRYDQRVHRRFVQTEPPEPITNRFPSRLPVRPTVEEEDPPICLDGVGVDPGRALEGKWCRDHVDPVAQ